MSAHPRSRGPARCASAPSGAAAREAPARQPALLRRLVDLRVRRADACALVVIIASGTILALKGPGWWHVTGVGHFFNSIHLWAVELFFFFMVIHLWGKYWMAAWRGGRARVWISGAMTFLVAVPCALTGYVSQQNFDAQWISTQAKDAMNSVGARRVLQPDELRPDVLLPRVAAAGRRGRAGRRPRAARAQARRRAAVRARALGRCDAGVGAALARHEPGQRRREDDAAREWKGGYRRYDLVKEASIALGVVLALALS